MSTRINVNNGRRLPPNRKAAVRGTRPRRRAAPRRARRTSRKDPTRVVRAICSLTDPWCEAAYGARIPDGNAGYSIPLRVQGLLTVTSNADGNAAVYLGSLQTGNATATTIDPFTGTITWPAVTDYPNAVNLLSNTKEYRIVTGGARFVPTVNNMTAAGAARFVELPSSDTLATTGINFNTYNYADNTIMPIRKNAELLYVYKKGGPASRSFVRYVISNDSNDWSNVCLFVSGAPASVAIGYIEFLFHLEMKPIASSTLAVMATPSPPANSFLTQAADNVSKVIQTSVETQVKSFSDKVHGAALDVVTTAGDAFLDTLPLSVFREPVKAAFHTAIH